MTCSCRCHTDPLCEEFPRCCDLPRAMGGHKVALGWSGRIRWAWLILRGWTRPADATERLAMLDGAQMRTYLDGARVGPYLHHMERRVKKMEAVLREAHAVLTHDCGGTERQHLYNHVAPCVLAITTLVGSAPDGDGQ